jgi:hypothetical protein
VSPVLFIILVDKSHHRSSDRDSSVSDCSPCKMALYESSGLATFRDINFQIQEFWNATPGSGNLSNSTSGSLCLYQSLQSEVGSLENHSLTCVCTRQWAERLYEVIYCSWCVGVGRRSLIGWCGRCFHVSAWSWSIVETSSSLTLVPGIPARSRMFLVLCLITNFSSFLGSGSESDNS